MVVLLCHTERQHLLVQEQAAQALLAGLPLLLQLPLAKGFLLELPLLGSFLKGEEQRSDPGEPRRTRQEQLQ